MSSCARTSCDGVWHSIFTEGFLNGISAKMLVNNKVNVRWLVRQHLAAADVVDVAVVAAVTDDFVLVTG